MAPGNGANYKGSKRKKTARTVTSPLQPNMVNVLPSNEPAIFKGDPEDPFCAAAAEFSSMQRRTLTPHDCTALRAFWNSALEVGGKMISEEIVDVIVKQAWHKGYEAGREWERKEIEEKYDGRWYEAYRQGEDAGRAEERDEWIISSHSLNEGKCISQATCNAEVQTSLSAPNTLISTATSNIAVQASFATSPETLDTWNVGTQTTPMSTLDTAVQTPSATMPTLVNQETQVESPPLVNWADEADAALYVLPAASTESTTAKSHPRDIFVLSSGSRRPFGTLQRRSRRLHHIPRTPQQHPFIRRVNYCNQPIVTHRHPSGISDDKPVFIVHLPSQPRTVLPVHLPTLRLDWDRDPRLFDLSKALRSLGWIRT